MLRYPHMQYRPLPAALRFHQSQKRFRWCIGGNRSSKSHALAQEVFWYATGTHPYRKVKVPATIWYCSITWEMVGAILWEKMQKLLYGLNSNGKLKEHPLFPHRMLWHNRAAGRPSTIFLPTNAGESRIIFKAYEQGADSFQGTERDLVANDEQFSQAVYTEQISRIGPGAECDFIAAMTPIKPQPWLEESMGDPPDAWDIFEFPLDDNRISRGGFIPDETIDGLIDEWPEEVQPTRRMGRWGSFLGAVYKSFSRQIHVVKEADEKLFFPEGTPRWDWKSVGGVDFGGANPFVYLLAVRIPHMDNAWYIYDEYYWDTRARGVRLMRDHAKHILQMNAKWKVGTTRVWADHDSQDRNELAAGGVITLAAKKDVILGIESIQTAMKHTEGHPCHFFIASRCINTIREHSTYRWPDGTDSNDPKDVPVKKDDHTCLSADTEIITSEGVYPIADLVGTTGIVLTAKGWKTYQVCIQTSPLQRLWRLEFDDGSFVDATEDHRFQRRGSMTFDTLRYINPGDILACYESKNNFIDDSGVQRQAVLPVREIFSAGWNPTASGGVETPLQEDPQRDAHPSSGSKQEQQSTQQSPMSAPACASVSPIYKREEKSSGKTTGENPSAGICMAPLPKRAGMASAAREGNMGITRILSENMSAMRQAIPNTAPGGVQILPSQLQNAGNVCETAKGRMVMSKREVVSAPTYCLKVEETGSFLLRNGILSHNCDTVRYIVYSESDAPGGKDIPGIGMKRKF